MSYTPPPVPAIPNPVEPFLLQDGTINPVWYRYLKAVDARRQYDAAFLKALHP